MCQLDGYTCNKIMNAFYKEFSCNGTEAATLYASEAASKFLNASRNAHNIHAAIEGEVDVNDTNAPNFDNNTTPLSSPTQSTNATNTGIDTSTADADSSLTPADDSNSSSLFSKRGRINQFDVSDHNLHYSGKLNINPEQELKSEKIAELEITLEKMQSSAQVKNQSVTAENATVPNATVSSNGSTESNETTEANQTSVSNQT